MSDETRAAAYVGTRQHISDYDVAILWTEKYVRDVLKCSKSKPNRIKTEIREEFKGCLDGESKTLDQPKTYRAEVLIEFDAEFE